MKKLRTVFYGITHEHAFGKMATLRQMADEFEIAGVVDDRLTATTPRFADHPASPDGFPVLTPEQVLSLENIDVVFIETTNADLMKSARLFAERGIPMHCDKPCGETMEPYRSIVEICRRKNLPFQIGYMYRGNPALKFAISAVRSGMLGQVSFIEMDMNHDYQLDGYPEYISSFKGGILYNLGCHLVDIVLSMVDGKLLSAKPIICDSPCDPAGSRTSGISLLSFEGGCNALIRAASHMPGGIDSRRLRIDGTNGTLELCPIERFDGERLKLELILKNPAAGFKPGRNVVYFGALDDRYREQIEDLAKIIRGEKDNDQDYDHDLLVHEVTLRSCGIEVDC